MPALLLLAKETRTVMTHHTYPGVLMINYMKPVIALIIPVGMLYAIYALFVAPALTIVTSALQ